MLYKLIEGEEMSTRNKNYIVLAIILAFIVIVVEFCNIPYLKSFQHQIYDYMKNPYIFIPALVCGIILMGRGIYWLLVLMCGIIDIAYITYNDGFSFTDFSITLPLLLSFLLVVFALNVIKALFSN